MRPITAAGTWLLCCLTLASAQEVNEHPTNNQSLQRPKLDDKLDAHVEYFATSGRPLIASVLEIVYQYEVPIGIEYVDHEAVTRPLDMELRNSSVRGILVAIIQQMPDYRVDFSKGMVEIYAPRAREDSSNLLNRVLKDFSATDVDTHDADLELFCELTRMLRPTSACIGSSAKGQWGPLKISLNLQNVKTYEILDAIVAQNGRALWTVTAPPERLSEVGGLWHIYPLDRVFEDVVLNKLSNIADSSVSHQSSR